MRNFRVILGCTIFVLTQGCGHQSDQEAAENPITTEYKADDWWAVDGSSLKCRPPLEDKGVVIDPKELMKRYKTCELQETNLQNVVGVSCQGRINTTIIFGRSMQACLDALKHIKAKTFKVDHDNAYLQKYQNKNTEESSGQRYPDCEYGENNMAYKTGFGSGSMNANPNSPYQDEGTYYSVVNS